VTSPASIASLAAASALSPRQPDKPQVPPAPAAGGGPSRSSPLPERGSPRTGWSSSGRRRRRSTRYGRHTSSAGWLQTRCGRCAGRRSSPAAPGPPWWARRSPAWPRSRPGHWTAPRTRGPGARWWAVRRCFARAARRARLQTA